MAHDNLKNQFRKSQSFFKLACLAFFFSTFFSYSCYITRITNANEEVSYNIEDKTLIFSNGKECMVFEALAKLSPVLSKFINGTIVDSINCHANRVNGFVRSNIIYLDLPEALLHLLIEILQALIMGQGQGEIIGILKSANLELNDLSDLYIVGRSYLGLDLPIKVLLDKINQTLSNSLNVWTSKEKIEDYIKENYLQKFYTADLAIELAKFDFYAYGKAFMSFKARDSFWRDNLFLNIGLDFGFSISELISHGFITDKFNYSFLDLNNLRINSLNGLVDLPGINHINQLLLSGNKLKELKKDDLVGAGSIIELALSKNGINKIARYTFICMSRLRSLNLAKNNLVSLEPKIFMGLTNLEMLILDDNLIEKIPQQVFCGLHNLINLSLADNNIKKIDLDAFSELKNLLFLNLRNNPITQEQIVKLKAILPKIDVYY